MKRLSTTFAVIAMLLASTVEAVTQTTTPPAKIEARLLARAEAQVETLKAKMLDLQMREIEMQARLADLDYQMRPENIQRSLQFVGSPRPMDEFRDALRKSLEREKSRVSQQIELINATRAQTEAAVSDAEAECVRLRKRLAIVP